MPPGACRKSKALATLVMLVVAEGDRISSDIRWSRGGLQLNDISIPSFVDVPPALAHEYAAGGLFLRTLAASLLINPLADAFSLRCCPKMQQPWGVKPLLNPAFATTPSGVCGKRHHSSTVALSNALLTKRGGSLKMQGQSDGGKLLASLCGWVSSTVSTTIYTPMILNLLRTRDPTGMSAATWALQLTGFIVFVSYHIRNRFPLSTFADAASLAVQSAAMLALICTFQGVFYSVAFLPFVALVLAILLPKEGLTRLQAVSTVVTTGALLPQILKNFAARSRGGWSPVSAALSVVGNAGRIFTSLQLAGGNPLLLAQYGMNTATNGILLIQSLVWS